MEGKSLRAVLNKCAQDGFPFTVDHSLLVASRLCTALEYIHSKKVNDQRLVHGFVCPETIAVTYDGEIKLQYLALAHALMKFPAGRDKFFNDYKNYLAPEVFSQQKLGKGADIYGVGAVLFEMLTGEALAAKGKNVNVNDAIDQAQLTNQSGDKSAIPDDLKKILQQSLATDPGQRFDSIADMRKALDLLLFSSEFSPTTFNLAFFMNSLFRENIDEENKNLTTFKKIDVSSYLKEEPPPPPKVEHPVGATAAKDVPMPMSMDKGPQQVFPAPEMFGGGEEKAKSKMPLVVGGLIGIALIATLVVLFLPKKQEPQQAAAPATQNQQTPQQKEAADAEKQKLMEDASKAQEEAKKKDQELADLKAKLDAMVKAQQQAQQPQQKPGTPAQAAPAVDTAAIQKLQEQAKKLEEEKKKSEALAEEKLKAAQTPPAPAPAENISSPTQVASNNPPANTTPDNSAAQQNPNPAVAAPDNTAAQAPGNTAAPAEVKQEVHEGDEVPMSADMIRPEVTNRVQPEYPPVAKAKKIEGTVILNAFISEKGDVIDVKILRPAGGSSGLNEAAATAVKKWKFQPGVKDGKRVKVWMAIPVVFKLQG